MLISKRDKKVSLTKTVKEGNALKLQLVEKHLETYNNLFVSTMHNMRNTLLKELREEWKDTSRFFFAKRKVMAIAVGRSKAEELQKNHHKVACNMVGQCGLLFTNRPKEEVIQRFHSYLKMDFAKSGFIATETVTLPAGPLPDFPAAIEPRLGALGFPTKLEKSAIVLREDHVVCTEGIRMTPEQATVLKHLGKQMAEFKITLLCVWSKDGAFEKFKVSKEVKKVPKKTAEPTMQVEVINEPMETMNLIVDNRINRIKIDEKSSKHVNLPLDEEFDAEKPIKLKKGTPKKAKELSVQGSVRKSKRLQEKKNN